MATQRTAPTLAGFFKFTKVGQYIVGLMDGYRDTPTSGPIATFTPCIISDGNVKQAWGSVAIGLSTDLKFKVERADRGRWFLIKFSDTEPTKKGSPRKVFTVATLDSMEEVKEMSEGVDMTHRNELYPVASAVFAGKGEADDSEDDLPF